MTKSPPRPGHDPSVSERRAPRTTVREPPDTPRQHTSRGARTRQALIEAGRVVFERDGFVDARVTDIASTAGVAHGTFYTYFESKHQLFREVVNEVAADMATPLPGDGRSPLPRQRVEEAIRHYLAAYRRNHRLLASLEQVATIDDDLRRLRSDARRAFVDRTERAIARWQAEGLADPDLDPRYAANALGNMVDRFAYVWMVLGEDFEEDRAVDTLSRLWSGGLAINGRHRRPRRTADQAS